MAHQHRTPSSLAGIDGIDNGAPGSGASAQGRSLPPHPPSIQAQPPTGPQGHHVPAVEPEVRYGDLPSMRSAFGAFPAQTAGMTPWTDMPQANWFFFPGTVLQYSGHRASASTAEPNATFRHAPASLVPPQSAGVSGFQAYEPLSFPLVSLHGVISRDLGSPAITSPQSPMQTPQTRLGLGRGASTSANASSMNPSRGAGQATASSPRVPRPTPLPRLQSPSPSTHRHRRARISYSRMDDTARQARHQARPMHSGSMHGSRSRISRRELQLIRGAIKKRKVASKDAMKSLRTVNVEDLDDGEKSCNICYVTLGDKSPDGVREWPVRIPGCRHVFGNHCIQQWLAESPFCPYCRHQLPSETRYSAQSGEATRNMLARNGIPFQTDANSQYLELSPEYFRRQYDEMEYDDASYGDSDAPSEPDYERASHPPSSADPDAGLRVEASRPGPEGPNPTSAVPSMSASHASGHHVVDSFRLSPMGVVFSHPHQRPAWGLEMPPAQAIHEGDYRSIMSGPHQLAPPHTASLGPYPTADSPAAGHFAAPPPSGETRARQHQAAMANPEGPGAFHPQRQHEGQVAGPANPSRPAYGRAPTQGSRRNGTGDAEPSRRITRSSARGYL